MFSNSSSYSRNPVCFLAWAIEFCWLTMLIMVPIIFLNIPDSPLELPTSREFPKIVLFRFLIFFIVVLWFLKYLLTDHSIPLSDQIRRILSLIKSKNIFRDTGQYFRNDPFRLIGFLATLYFLSVILSTLFSNNLRMSLWGYIPGSDNHSFYNLLHYGLLFFAIGSNLRDRNQLLRLLMVVIVVGVLVSVYGVFQYYGLDFLRVGVYEWDLRRVLSTLGNPIFLGSFLIFPIWITMMVGIYAAISCDNIKVYWINIVIWALVIGVQITALLYTASRGPILAVFLSLCVFPVFAIFVFGLKNALKSFLVPTFALVVSIGFISVPNLLASESSHIFDNDNTASVQYRTYTDISSDGVISSSLLQRISIIKSSLAVIRDRPNIDDNATGFKLLDHLFGYGPESFHIAFMHRSGVQTSSKIPISTNHPHNFLLHSWIELGILGVATIFGLVIIVIVVCSYQLVRFRHALTTFQGVFLIGMIALVFARILEQLLGVAAVTDLMMFWMMVAIACNFMVLTSETSKKYVSVSKSVVTSPRFLKTFFNQPVLFGTTIFVIMILATLLWFKTIIPVMAFAQSSNINEDFGHGNFAGAVESLQDSLIIDPAQYLYHSNLAYVYEAASESQMSGAQIFNCSDANLNTLDTDECFSQLVYRAYLSSIDAGDMRWESRYKAAQAATELAVLLQSQSIALDAIRLYEESIFMVPNSHVIRLSFAQALLDFGNPEKAMDVLMDSLDIIGDSPVSTDSKFWLGIANAKMGNVSVSYDIWSEVIAIDPSYIEAHQNLALIDEAYGQIDVALERSSHVISLLEIDLDSWSDEGVSSYYPDLTLLQDSLIEAYLQRASIYHQEGIFSLRDADVDRLLELGVDPVNISHLR